jgi:SagB-type dehydrogenase family enzyme
MRGLLEDSAADPASPPASFDSELLAFLRRHVDATRVNRSGWEALRRLNYAKAGVCVTGLHAEETAAHIVNLLKNAGVGFARRVNFGNYFDDVFTEGTVSGTRTLVVLIDGCEDTDALEGLDNQCAELGIPWIRARVDMELLTAELGPYFERGETACYKCFQNSRLAEQPPADRRNTLTTYGADRLMRRAWASIVASEAIYVMSRIGPMTTRGLVAHYNLTTWDVERLAVCRMPGCVDCRGPGASNQIGPTPVAVAYEDAVAFPSRHLLDPKSHQIHYHAHSLELAYQSKQYPSAPRFPLPVACEATLQTGDALNCVMRGSAVATEPLTLGRLAALLMFTAGLNGEGGQAHEKLRRWAPTGGNLGSVELYVAAEAVDGLESGIYFYQVHGHALARLSSMEAGKVAAFIDRAAPGRASVGAALMVFVAAYERVAQKYASFGYRVVQLDAGVAIAQMQAAANGLGLKVAIAHGWRCDVIADELRLIRSSELVTCAAHVCGGRYA